MVTGKKCQEIEKKEWGWAEGNKTEKAVFQECVDREAGLERDLGPETKDEGGDEIFGKKDECKDGKFSNGTDCSEKEKGEEESAPEEEEDEMECDEEC